MEFEEFLEYVKKEVEAGLGNEYAVYKNRVRKNNNVHYSGIVIRRGAESVCPAVYLDEYYLQYSRGRNPEEIIADVLNRYREAMCQTYGNLDLSLEAVKDRIIYRLINREKNKEILKESPSAQFLDMAVTFHILLEGTPGQEQASIRITNEMMEMWGLELKLLTAFAGENTKKHLPPVFYTLNEILGKMMLEIEQKEEEALFCGKMDEEVCGTREALQELEVCQEEMYILTNQKSIHGAAAVLYPDVIGEFSEKLGKDLYLLPSSVHEFILIPAGGKLGKKEFEHMVRSVNHTQLPEEDFLSDYVYYYDRNRQEIFKL